MEMAGSIKTAAHEGIQSVATNVTYAASATAVIGGFTVTEWAAIGGFVVAVFSAGVNLYFKIKDRKPK